MLFDMPQAHQASTVAAGLFNVITGRYGAKTWQTELLLEELHAFLDTPELASLKQHVHFSPVYRPFKTVEEYNKMMGRMAIPEYAGLVDWVHEPLLSPRIQNELGGIRILPCGAVDTRGFLDEALRLFQEFGGEFVEDKLEYNAISPQKGSIEHGTDKIEFDHLIFAEGYKMIENPFFQFVKLIPNKGEILIIESEALKLDFVVSRKVYLIPLGENKYLVGSSYTNGEMDPSPTSDAKTEIMGHLEKAINVPYKVVDQLAGIRPTTPNRRPILGTHPTYNNLHICNGYGTKGVLYMSWASKQLSNRILKGFDKIPYEADLRRFIVEEK